MMNSFSSKKMWDVSLYFLIFFFCVKDEAAPMKCDWEKENREGNLITNKPKISNLYSHPTKSIFLDMVIICDLCRLTFSENMSTLVKLIHCKWLKSCHYMNWSRNITCFIAIYKLNNVNREIFSFYEKYSLDCKW